MNISQGAPRTGLAQGATTNPLMQFLGETHSALALDGQGAIADYIPELSKADPGHFGIALATMDGHVYTIGDAFVPFTIQSISKAFVFALCLDIIGPERVEARVGVEPSGDAFNSIRLRPDNRPFNPMVNAGAIACSGMIHEAEGDNAAERIREALGRFAGRDLAIDESVFASERLTGDRNRAIAYLLHNYGLIKGDVDAVLDVYFRQCSILVTARDLALMAATLANNGVNPSNGERVISPYTVSRTLSVMTSSGMYGFAGEWIYRIGLPAKSGVGGGIVVSLPAQFGLGSFSPLLDEHGNSVRGLKVCKSICEHFDLHMLNHTSDVRICIVADYDFAHLSPRGRQPHEQRILNEHKSAVRVIELTGTLNFGNADLIVRRIETKPPPPVLILDFSRVAYMSIGAAKILTDVLGALIALGTTPVLSGVEKDSVNWNRLAAPLSEGGRVRNFVRLDEAIEWAEDQIIYRFGGFTQLMDLVDLSDQELLAGLPAELVREIGRLGSARTFRTGERIIAAGAESTSIFFLQSGLVSVKLVDGVRLATLVPGMVFGEMALVERRRAADVWADTTVRCIELPLERFRELSAAHPRIGEQIMRNLAALLAGRLSRANQRVNLLSP